MFSWTKKDRHPSLSDLSEKEIMAIAQACCEDLARIYRHFRSTLKFKSDVRFEDILSSFQPPALEFVKVNYPSIYRQNHTKTFFRVLLSGMEMTDLDQKSDILRVADKLGVADDSVRA